MSDAGVSSQLSEEVPFGSGGESALLSNANALALPLVSPNVATFVDSDELLTRRVSECVRLSSEESSVPKSPADAKRRSEKLVVW